MTEVIVERVALLGPDGKLPDSTTTGQVLDILVQIQQIQNEIQLHLDRMLKRSLNLRDLESAVAARLFMWASITSGMTQMLGWVKGPSQDVYYPNISPGEGMESNPTFSALSNTSTTVCCGLSYRGAHDLATRTRIFDWLMRRYKS